MPREPDVFGQPIRPIVERGVHDVRDLLDLRPLDAGHGIEVDAQLVRVIEIVGPHRVRVQLEAREVGHPDERGGVARDETSAVRPDGKCSDTTSIHSGRDSGALLVEELAADAVRIADQDVGPAAGARSAPSETAR